MTTTLTINRFNPMEYVVNPSGRIVSVQDDHIDEWLTRPDFRKATQEEISKLNKERARAIHEINNPQQSNLVYMATVSGGNDGYGMSSRHIMNALKDLKVDISTVNQDQKIGFLYHNPYSIMRMNNPIKVIYTMFESDKIPADWKEYLDCADRVIVPSKWCANVFASSGVKADVVPLGYNDEVFTYREREDKRETRKDFIFLHYNAYNIRKGFPEVLKAFCKAFEKDEPVKMIFKTTVKMLPFPLPKSEYPNIEVMQGEYPEDQLAALCSMADCFVYPSRGEGFGITPLEAMATGASAIVPNAHGISEYFDDRYMYEVKVKETCPALYSKYKGQDVGKMVVCDVDHLAAQMRWVYEHQEEARQKGQEASEYVKKYTYKNTAQKLKTIIEELDQLPIPDHKVRNILPLKEV